jgi:small subunit ribosomal protein S1
VNNQNHRTSEGTNKDEAWWASLLADEERYGNPSAFKASINQFIEKDVANHAAVRPAVVNWDYVQHLFDDDETVELSVSGFNRGGLLVEEEGIHGFVPISHLVDVVCDLPDDEREVVLESYIDRRLSLKVIECDPPRGRVVFSERAALSSTGQRNQLLRDLQPGQCVSGIVTNITDFGVFVDLGGVEGLVHVSEISWGRVRHPADLVQIGEKISAYVIQVDKERARIALSLKRMCCNPWETAEQRYHQGQIVDAVITSVVPYGAFARLEEGLDGLIHISEMGLDSVIELEERLHEGQMIQARILHIDSHRQRLGLSLDIEEIVS